MEKAAPPKEAKRDRAVRRKTCPICGPIGIYADTGYTLGHTATCTPALRALVRAAERMAKLWDMPYFEDERGETHKSLYRAWRRWKKSKEAKP